MNDRFDSHFGRRGGDLVETSKQVQVLDRFGNVRFAVRLDEEGTGYVVRVRSVQMGFGHDLLVREELPLYKQAQAFFYKMVDRYQALAKAETLGPRDIRVYAERIKYHKAPVECCATCKYGCRFFDGQGVFGPRVDAMKGKLLCANDKMLDPLREQDADRLGTRRGPDMRPVVEAGCVCMGYERRQCPHPRPPCPPPRPPRPPFPPHPHCDPEEYLTELVENVVSGKIGEITENVISAVGDDMVSAVTQNVSADVQQRIDGASISVINTISADIQAQLDDMVITGNDDLDEVYYGGGA